MEGSSAAESAESESAAKTQKRALRRADARSELNMIAKMIRTRNVGARWFGEEKRPRCWRGLVIVE